MGEVLCACKGLLWFSCTRSKQETGHQTEEIIKVKMMVVAIGTQQLD